MVGGPGISSSWEEMSGTVVVLMSLSAELEVRLPPARASKLAVEHCDDAIAPTALQRYAEAVNLRLGVRYMWVYSGGPRCGALFLVTVGVLW